MLDAHGGVGMWPAAVRRGPVQMRRFPAPWRHDVLREYPAEAPQRSGNAPCSAMMLPTKVTGMFTRISSALTQGMLPDAPHFLSRLIVHVWRDKDQNSSKILSHRTWNLELETWTWDLEFRIGNLKLGIYNV